MRSSRIWMPGRSPNDNETRLFRKWENQPQSYPMPLLRQIDISSESDEAGNPVGTGLRGIRGLSVPFNSPVVAICGKNGVGKSTILALAALAFNSPVGWFVSRGHFQIRPRTGDRDHFGFPDFFHHADGDSAPNGIRIVWRYSNAGVSSSLEFEKRSNRWLKYSKRPERNLDYAAMSRVLPATEIRALRRNFSLGCGARVESLQPAYRTRLSAVLGRAYNEADVRRVGDFALNACRAESTYTGFNMGAGESSLIALMSVVQRLPPGGLLVIEEVELGLHHEAQVRLAQLLVATALERSLQIICSTHSEAFLDALPKRCRLLIRRVGENHEAVEAPTTRFAVHEMSGELRPELIVYCEDGFAADLIEACLDANQRRRVRMVPIGSDRAVVRQLVAHERGRLRPRAMAVLDGDIGRPEIDGMVRSEAGENHRLTLAITQLPGAALPPERWALAELGGRAYAGNLASLMNCTAPEVAEHVRAMGLEADHHEIFHRLFQRTGVDRAECSRRIARAVSDRHPQLDPLRDAIRARLEA